MNEPLSNLVAKTLELPKFLIIPRGGFEYIIFSGESALYTYQVISTPNIEFVSANGQNNYKGELTIKNGIG